MPSATQDWVTDLSIMQQSVLFSAVRNADGVAKHHPSKALIRWYRRCVLISAFDGKALTTPNAPGGGSFTGPVADIKAAADDFIVARDEMTLHYYAHAMHAFEIVGYHHPVPWIRAFWSAVYVRMCHALHMWPETKEQMDVRLGDTQEGWENREDPPGSCST